MNQKITLERNVPLSVETTESTLRVDRHHLPALQPLLLRLLPAWRRDGLTESPLHLLPTLSRLGLHAQLLRGDLVNITASGPFHEQKEALQVMALFMHNGLSISLYSDQQTAWTWTVHGRQLIRKEPQAHV